MLGAWKGIKLLRMGHGVRCCHGVESKIIPIMWNIWLGIRIICLLGWFGLVVVRYFGCVLGLILWNEWKNEKNKPKNAHTGVEY